MFHFRGVQLLGGPRGGNIFSQTFLLCFSRTCGVNIFQAKELCSVCKYLCKHNHLKAIQRTCKFISNADEAASHARGVGFCPRSRAPLLSRPEWSRAVISRSISTAGAQKLFWEREPKGGYGRKIKYNHKELIRDGLRDMRSEITKWKEELQEQIENDPIIVRPGDMDKILVLDSEESLNHWIVTCDSDHCEGYSSASLSVSPTGHGLFSGHISTQVPKDGKTKRAGYCNMRTIRPRKSFRREMYLDWSCYNHLELRVRGDGRSYLVNISTAGYYDITWNDMFSYVLYTRGGPHWQITRIPFSKFFFNSKGRAQDKQVPIVLHRVVSLGISAGDRVNAPFRLEIDYIGLYNDPDHTETFAYEMYRVPKYTSAH
ncbi:complex I intermediate-associated protein 30, mitochondrial [Procambarus clarkii]|uniref:complex I intermediate-associated protein 30, mitochondrial n=1 Tax=Procambarus clarkii TaxID=6728 RepID=UPI001E673BA8|nr:complex I intermediate-associated protein 30, mitochondrial-like [Procambarus clarkii]XP_045581044.1 complex I intermediate-associated protein 30, mitochondrial-like [Procambarus clarkii]XP_045581045.1 complex I intermediate-associated protein 30, mitochondrial-like [Procambarus clarkii]XP_045581046.1 complex I intermediate-associated protein 30, mitochondrial-like [Procambarus clarkii]